MIENQVALYFSIGAGLSIADRISSRIASGHRETVRQHKQYAQALDFLLDAYDPKEFEMSMKDAEFSGAFEKTQEYFARKKEGTLDAPKKPSKAYASTAIGNAQKSIDSTLGKTMTYLKGEKLNTAPFVVKAGVSWGIPLIGDIYNAVQHFTISGFMGGLGETAIIYGPSFLIGVYLGKGVNYIADRSMRKYNARLEKLEKKLALNAELKAALEQKPFEVNVPVAKTDAPVLAAPAAHTDETL